MKKVKITADGILAILKSVLSDSDIDVIDDPNAPQEWQGKSISDILNVDYYTFKYRPQSTEQIIADLQREGVAEIDTMQAVNRNFCCFVLGEVERVFTKDVDVIACEAMLDFWIQSDKIKLIEMLVEKANIALTGIRIPVWFEAENEWRKATIIFEAPVVDDIDTESVIGEAIQCPVEVSVLINPDVVTYSDYIVKFSFIDNDEYVEGEPIPCSSFSRTRVMVQDPIPSINNPSDTGTDNLSCARAFVLVFDGFSDNKFIEHITDLSLKSTGAKVENNTIYQMKVQRKEKVYFHEVKIKDHQLIVNSDTGNEIHTLTLTTA